MYIFPPVFGHIYHVMGVLVCNGTMVIIIIMMILIFVFLVNILLRLYRVGR
jgi:hypothetical protein